VLHGDRTETVDSTTNEIPPRSNKRLISDCVCGIGEHESRDIIH